MERKKKNQGAVWISTGLTHKGFTESQPMWQPCGFIFSRQKKFTRACNCQAFLQASTASESQRLLNLLSECPFTQFHSTLRLL